ncbi:MAG: ribonuclease HI family protein [Nitrospira sp.]
MTAQATSPSTGPIEGLRRAYDMGAKDIELRMDSELVIRQIEGRYQVRKDTLKPMQAEVMTLLQAFKKYRVKHVLRGQNARADELANQGYPTRVLVINQRRYDEPYFAGSRRIPYLSGSCFQAPEDSRPTSGTSKKQPPTTSRIPVELRLRDVVRYCV